MELITFEEFKERIVSDIEGLLNEPVRVFSTSKVNVVKTGITLRNSNSINACVYIEDLYEEYKNIVKKNSFFGLMAYTETLYRASDLLRKKSNANVQQITSIDYIRKNIYMCLMNTEKNRKKLKEIPNRKFFDLSIYYRVKVSTDDKNATASYILNNNVLEMIGITEGELYKIAYENTPKMFKLYTLGMSIVMHKMLREIPPLSQNLEVMFVSSNENSYNGSINILYPDELRAISDIHEDDLYIIPSSIHEIILVPTSMLATDNLEEIREICMQVNKTSVKEDEVLSDTIYKYNRETGYITVCANSDNQ